MQPALLDFFARRVNEGSLVRLQYTDLGIGARGRLFNACKTDDQVGMDGYRPAADGKVFKRASCVDTPVGVRRNVERTDAVALFSHSAADAFQRMYAFVE